MGQFESGPANEVRRALPVTRSLRELGGSGTGGSALQPPHGFTNFGRVPKTLDTTPAAAAGIADPVRTDGLVSRTNLRKEVKKCTQKRSEFG